MGFDIKKKIRPERNRSYLNKDFDSLRAELLRYARTYFPDKIKDFSEASLGGLLLDMAAFVGDVNSFYLDHQFNELNVETAVETTNIERHIRNAGVKITGASPAFTPVTVYIEVPAEILSDDTTRPQRSALPIIGKGTVFTANNGVTFELVDDLNFAETDVNNVIKAASVIAETDSSGRPLSYVIYLTGDTISGKVTTETFSISNSFVPFRTITLSQDNITEIISITDAQGNVYYEVESLTQDTVFKGILNKNDDDELVKENLEIIPAPYRFTSSTSFRTGLTTIQFGSGKADSIDDDVIPDPSELALPLFGKRSFSRFSINPGNLLNTQTLGISPVNTTITVQYRYGGGLRHNVAAETIRTVTSLNIKFKGGVSASTAQFVRASIDVTNISPASGGENPPTLFELRDKVPAARNSQARIVTREDLLARVYTMPSNFGRVFRAGIRSNPNNPLATQLFIVSRDVNSNLITSPDSLKKNLRVYLNQFRLISDAIDILDAQVIDIGVKFSVVADPAANKNAIVQTVISNLATYFDISNFQIDAPIVISEAQNIIINSPGVISLTGLEIFNRAGIIDNRAYSNISLNIPANTFRGLVIPPPGGIFQMKYPNVDIIGSAT